MAQTAASDKDPSQSPRLTLQTARNRVTRAIADALEARQPTLIEALPGTGKSRGIIEAVQQVERPITILTCRGREEQYPQFRDWCADVGVSVNTLPSAYHDCPTAAGEHSPARAKEINDLLDAGVSASRVHRERDWPCEQHGRCTYLKKLDFDPDQVDVLLGYYTHAHLKLARENRVVIYDEFPGDAYTNTLEPADITAYLNHHRGIPFDNFTDLIENRGAHHQTALDTLQHRDLRDEKLPLHNQGNSGHALSGLGVLTLLRSTDLGNGWEHAPLGRGRIGLFDRQQNRVHIFTPPRLHNEVVALDGTPTREMWELALGFYDQRGRSLDVQRVLDDQEREEYVTEVQDLTIVPTTTNIRPYSSGNNTTPQRDAALITAIERRHGDTAGIISSTAGLEQLLIDTGRRPTARYGNLMGSNKLGNVDIGIILGSPHYGDPFIKQWTALAGIYATSNGRYGTEKSYGPFGNSILQHMREHNVVQALFRFARQGDGATVYVDTRALPDWIPVTVEPTEVEVSPRADGRSDIFETLERLQEARTSQIAEETGLSAQYVRKVLNELCKEGFVSKQPAPDGRGGAKIFVDVSLAATNPFGDVEFPSLSNKSGFSKLSPIRGLQGRVSKERRTEKDLSTDDEAHHEAIRRRNRQRHQVWVEAWRDGGSTE